MKTIKKIVVAGAGTMGDSLVQILAAHGYNTVLQNRRQASLDNAKKLIALNQESLISEGVQTIEESAEILKKISFSCDKDCFKDADLVIETIIEDMEIKHEFWKEISSIVQEDALLTTNTSGLSISKIAEAVYKPERFVGMHWWNPPHLVPLVEIIKGDYTSDETANDVIEITENLGQKPVLVSRDIPGFIGNRLQAALLREALNIVEMGAGTFEDVDNAVKYGIGMRYACVGPFETADLGGIDTFNKITSYLFADLCDESDGSPTLRRLVASNRLGVKNGHGFYDYEDGKAEQAIKNRDEKFIRVLKSLHNK